jgi:hypothetical protein
VSPDGTIHAITASSSLVVGASPITGGTSGRIEYNNAGVLGELPTVGSGNVALSSAIPNVPIEAYGGGCSVSDNTSALIAAAASSTGPVNVLFPGNCIYTFRQADAIIFNKGVTLEGMGVGVTELNFLPASDGTFLNWQAPVAFNFEFGGGLRNLSLISTASTHTKIMVKEAAFSNFNVFNVNCGEDQIGGIWTVVTGGTGSTCYEVAGWQFINFNTVWAGADIPLHILKNPYWVYNDHFHFTNMVLTGTANIGLFQLVQVDPGAVFSNMTWDGYQSWNNGSTGFFYDGSTAWVNNVYEIVAGGTNYAVGDTVTLAPGAGGSCTVNPKVLITAISGGAVTSASVMSNFAGTCTAQPTGDLWTQVATSGSGTGLQVHMYASGSFNVKFSNIRIEQGGGTPSSWWSIQFAPRVSSNNIVIDNSVLDGLRGGILLTHVNGATISNNTSLGGSTVPVTLINALAATGNDDILLLGNRWYGTSNYSSSFGTLNKVWGIPSGVSGVTTPVSAYYNSAYKGAQSVAINADVLLNNVSTYFDGPSVTVGTQPATWDVTSTVTLFDSAGAAQFFCKLWDGTTVYATAGTNTAAASRYQSLTLGAVVTSAPSGGIIKTSCVDTASVSGKIVFSASGFGLSSMIKATLH